MTAGVAPPAASWAEGVTVLLPALPPPVRRPRFRRWLPLCLLVLVNLLVLVDALSPVRSVVVLPLLILLPGYLTLRLCGARRPSGADRVLHVVAFGLLWLLGLSLVLGLLGALTPGWCLLAFDLVVAALVSLVRGQEPVRPPRASAPVESAAGTGQATPAVAGTAALYVSGSRPAWQSVPPSALAAIALAGTAVALAVLGAHRLNAGGSWVLTGAGLASGAAALLLIAAAARANADSRSDRAVLPAASVVVYLLGLAVLLATSLRGAGVTGHDIKPEFRVFQDTLAAGAWNPGGDLADYMSCLSITTLPAFLHHLLGVAPLDVFRVCYQVIFAAVPVGVLLIARTLVPTAPATLAAGLYVAFPTFVNDLPMLNRQELALLFFTVAVLTLLDRHGSPRQRTAVFAAMIAGLTVSHYSSTYVAGAVMLAAWALLGGEHLMRRRDATADGRAARLLGRVDRLLARVSLRRSTWAGPHLLTLRAVVIVILASAAWSFATGSGAGLVSTVRTAAASVASDSGAESDAVGYSFLRDAPDVTDEQALGEFVTANGSRPSVPEQQRYAKSCPTVLQSDEMIPRTAVGSALGSAGIAPEQVNSYSRKLTVVLYELGALAGTILLWVHSRRKVGPAHVLGLLSAGTLIALAGTVLLPQLSVDYGLLRLFQQSLVVLAPAVLLALTGATRVLGRRAAAAGSAFVVTGCLLSTSGLLPQIIGGFEPQLNLNNAGAYHRAYYTSADDLAAAGWVRDNLTPDTLLSADSAAFRTLRSMTALYPLEGVAPTMVPPSAYLQVDQVGPDRAEAVAIVRDRILTYRFRLSCVTAGRPLRYSAGDHRIYGPVP